MIGLECPRPGTSARHSKPSGSPTAAATFQLARVGNPSEMPCPPGPRNCGQFCSDLNASEAAGNASKEAVRNEPRDNGIAIHRCYSAFSRLTTMSQWKRTNLCSASSSNRSQRIIGDQEDVAVTRLLPGTPLLGHRPS